MSGERKDGGAVHLKIQVDVDIDRPFVNAEQERYFLASLETALEEAWFDYLADEEYAPQEPSNARAMLLATRTTGEG